MDLTLLADAELDELRSGVLNEIERRNRLAMIPDQIAELKRRFTEDGGDPAVLQEVVPV